MHKAYISVVALVLLAACGQSNPTKPDSHHTAAPKEAGSQATQASDWTSIYNDDQLNSIALEKLWPSFPLEYQSPYSAEEIQASQEKLDHLRPWVETVKPIRLRNEYRKWISYWQSGINDARKELRNRQIVEEGAKLAPSPPK